MKRQPTVQELQMAYKDQILRIEEMQRQLKAAQDGAFELLGAIKLLTGQITKEIPDEAPEKKDGTGAESGVEDTSEKPAEPKLAAVPPESAE